MPMFSDFHEDPKCSADSQPAMDDLDTCKRDRFELLSAYLDSEVTAAERKQVESWLATDPDMQCLYARLLKLRHRIQNMPIPVPQESVEKTLEQVLTRIDRRPRFRLVLGGLGAATAAVVIGALTSLIGSDRTLSPVGQAPDPPSRSVARTGPAESTDPTALMVALDRPPVEIPGATGNADPQQRQGLELDWQQNIR